VDEAVTLHSRLTLAVVAAVGLMAIARSIARRRLTLGYGLLWLGVFAGLAALAVFPGLAFWLGRLAGSREPEGAVRLAGFIFIVVVLLYLSLRTSELQQKVHELVQELALREPQRPDERTEEGEGPAAAPP
jgi:hypothetical protein